MPTKQFIFALLLCTGCSAQDTDNRFVINKNTFSLGGYDFGFSDGGYQALSRRESDSAASHLASDASAASTHSESGPTSQPPDNRRWSQMHLGPLGKHAIPVSATVAWVIVAAVVWLVASLAGYRVFLRDRVRNRGGNR